MKIPRLWRGLIAGSVAALSFAPAPGFALVEKTETQGDIPADLNGVWLLVSEIEHNVATPTPAASPAPGESAAPESSPGAAAKRSVSAALTSPTPAAKPSPGTSPDTAASVKRRIYSVAHLLKITHLKKEEVDRIKEEEAKRQQASVDKATAMIAAEAKAKGGAPQKNEGGEIAGAKVLVPTNDSIAPPPAGDQVDIALLDVVLPKAIQDVVQKSQQGQTRWVPTDKDRALLRSSWRTLKPNPKDEYSKIEWKVIAAEHFDTGLKTDEKTRGARFAITGNQQMIPKPGQPSNNIVVFGVRQDTGQTLSGGHVRAMMATAPFPIPIDMKGSFTMYRIADLPKSTAAKAQKAAKAKPPAKSE